MSIIKELAFSWDISDLELKIAMKLLVADAMREVELGDKFELVCQTIPCVTGKSIDYGKTLLTYEYQKFHWGMATRRLLKNDDRPLFIKPIRLLATAKYDITCDVLIIGRFKRTESFQ